MGNDSAELVVKILNFRLVAAKSVHVTRTISYRRNNKKTIVSILAVVMGELYFTAKMLRRVYSIAYVCSWMYQRCLKTQRRGPRYMKAIDLQRQEVSNFRKNSVVIAA